MKKTKLLLVISIFSLLLSSCSVTEFFKKEPTENPPDEVVETTKEDEKDTEIDNEFTVDYDSYMGKWYIFNSKASNESSGEIIFKTDADDKIKISVNNYSGNDNLTQLETLRFISEFTALGEGEITKNSSTKYQFSFKSDDDTKEDFCEINIVDKKTKEQLSAPLYLYRISVKNASPAVQLEAPQPEKPTPPKTTSKKETFEQRAAAIESYESTASANAYTQQEINIATYNIFEKWDALLNDVYQHLKSTLPASEFKALKNDELAWIKEKDAAIEREAAEWEGGSAEAMIRNSVATNYTKERCYYLISLVK